MPSFYLPFWRESSKEGAKQGSGDFLDNETSRIALRYYDDVTNLAARMYDVMINELDVCPEQARLILPQGLLTEWYWTGSLAAYARFYRQRIVDGAQWEIRRYAEVIGEFIGILFPESWEALTYDLKDIQVPNEPPPVLNS
jgi:thymidylate synthase (FAD)